MPELAPIRPVPPMARDMDLQANRLPSTLALNGAAMTLSYDEGEVLTLAFADARVRWAIGARAGEDAYDAVEVRPGMFFVHLASAATGFGLSHVLDRTAGRAVTAWDETAGGTLRRHIRTARIGDAPDYRPVPETRELIGRRAYCEYSSEAALEHVYVNSSAIVWQWLLLPDDPRFDALRTEVGIEAVSMRKVADDLFLVSLNDGGPVGLTLLMDFMQKRNVGMLFGLGRNGGLLSRPVGATITLLNALAHPPGYEPG